MRFEDTRSGRVLDQHLVPISSEAGQVVRVAVFAEDITERRQMEEELRRSERLFRLAFEESPVGRCLVGVDGRIGKTNPAFCALLGRSQQELAGLSFLEITHPEDRQTSAAGVRQLLEGTLDRLDLEKRYLTPEPRTVWASVHVGLFCDDAGSPLHFSFFVQDISERKQAEAALLERDEQLRSIASSIPGAIYQFVRKADGSVEIPFMSEGARLLFDRPLEELQNPAHLFDDVHPDDVPGLWASIEASAKDLTPWSVEFRLVPKTAPLRWLRGASNPHPLPDGGVCWNGVLLDITEQKRGDEQTRLQHRLALALAAASDLQQGLRLCVEIAVQASGLDAAGFYLLDETSGGLELCVPQGLTPELVATASRFEALSDQTRLVMAGLPVYARLEDLGVSLSEAERREGLRFIAIIPLHHEGKVIGCMNVASHKVDDLPLASRQVLETIAATAAQAIARLRAEERLRRSEALLNHTQRLSKAGGWEWDVIRETMVWTEETYRLHDLSAQEIAPGSDEHIRRSVGCYAPEHQATISEAFRRCTERGEAYDLEVPFTSVTGRPMWVRTTAEAVWDGNRVVKVLGNLMDITERKRAEEALQRQVQRYDLVVAGVRDAIWDWDVPCKRVFFSPRWKEMRGYAEHEVSDSDDEWHRGIHPEDLPRVLAQVEAHFAGKTEVFSEEYRVRCKDGGWKWVLDRGIAQRSPDGQVVRMAGSDTDITERKLAEEALRKLSQAVEQSPASVMITDLQGNTEYVNRRFSELTGYSAAEILGQNPRILRSGQTPAETYRQLWAAITQGDEWDGEMLNRKKNGELFWERALISPIKDAGGRITHYLGIKEDITERKRAEAELQASREQLRALATSLTHAEQRERRRIATLLHDDVIQSLALTQIKLGALRVQQPSAELQTLLDSIRSHLEGAIGSTRSMTFQLSPPILHELGLEAALGWLAEQFTSEHGVQFEFVADAPPVALDEETRNLLFTAVRELLLNVVKHARATRSRVTTQTEGGWLRVVVEDDGVGWQPDSTARPDVKTGGFGLFSIRERLSYLGGQCDVQSAPTRGTRVTLTMPLKQI